MVKRTQIKIKHQDIIINMPSRKKENLENTQEQDAIFSVGKYLRSQRESQKISIREVADATKIARIYLEAIEEEKWDLISAEVYRRGFIKNYSKFLGLNPEEILQKYDKATPNAENKINEAMQNFSFYKEESNFNLFQWTIISLLILILLGGIIYLFYF
jgi:cytoskeletal protein RodZ